jgi:hypothetical protein
MFKLTILLLAFAQVLVTQAQTPCPLAADTTPKCETSDGSPVVSNCQQAVAQSAASGLICENINSASSACSTHVTVSTCKIDSCSAVHVSLAANPPDLTCCSDFLQKILDTCQSNSKVGGQIVPAGCLTGIDDALRVQFSHS